MTTRPDPTIWLPPGQEPRGGGNPTNPDPGKDQCCMNGECSSSRGGTKCHCPPICFANSRIVFQVLPVMATGPGGPDDYYFTGRYQVNFSGCIYVAGRSQNGGTLQAVCTSSHYETPLDSYPVQGDVFELANGGGRIVQDFMVKASYSFGGDDFVIEVRCLNTGELCASKRMTWNETKSGANGSITKIKAADDDVPGICSGFNLFEGPYEEWSGLQNVCDC